MPALTIVDKIQIMSVASKQFHSDSPEPRIDPTRQIIDLYHAMIEAITASEDSEEKKKAFRSEI